VKEFLKKVEGEKLSPASLQKKYKGAESLEDVRQTTS
jgi:hypothetical protein